MAQGQTADVWQPWGPNVDLSDPEALGPQGWCQWSVRHGLLGERPLQGAQHPQGRCHREAPAGNGIHQSAGPRPPFLSSGQGLCFPVTLSSGLPQ